MYKYVNFNKKKGFWCNFFNSHVIHSCTYFLWFLYQQGIICSVTDLMIKSFT